MLSSKTHDIDSIAADPDVIRGILNGYVYDAVERGTQLPDAWMVDITVKVIVGSRFTDERVLRLEGVVTPTD